MRKIIASALCAAAFAIAAAAPASAGDGYSTDPKNPELDIVGFNGRGLYFGIEQFGIRPDGKTPYSEIHIYDLRHDDEIERSPFVYDVKEKIPEGVTLEGAIEHARRGVYHDAKRVLRFLTLVPRGKHITPPDDKPAKALRVSAPGLFAIVSVGEFPLKADHCKGIETKGLILTMESADGKTELHRDKRIPKKRGCPVSYGIKQVSIFQPDGNLRSIAVIAAGTQGGKQAGHIRYFAVGKFYNDK